MAAPVGLVVAGLGLWARGLSLDTPWQEWLAQAVWAVFWLAIVEWSYGAVLGATTGRASRPTRLVGAARSWRDPLVLALAAGALVPLAVVAETSAQWAANRLLYDPGYAEPTYLGFLRGLIDSRHYAARMATVDEPLRAFSRVVLGWQDESHPFAIVMCAAMLGDMLWAPLAMLIGTGRLRAAAPILARAFRLAALQAATAPLFTLAYFLVRGGDGLNVWSGLLGVLVGSIDAGGQVPSSVRVVGTSIFFLLPAVMVAWRLGADRRALGAREDAASAPVPGVRGASGALSPRRRWTMPVAAALVVPLLGIWSLHVSAGPWSWVGQSVWLALWLGFLAACHRGVLGLTPEGRRLSHAAEPGLGWAAEYARLLAGAWPLAVAGVVVQVGLQWLVTAPGAGVRFFGWFLGQVDQPRGDGPLLPAAMAVAFLANALWTWMLLALAKLGWHERLVRAARTLELGALQAATTPLALVAFMVLSIITRDRAAPGIPRYDVWHAWTYVARAAVGASFATETVPAWLSLVAAGFLIGLPLAAARACFIVERRALRRWLGSEDLDGDAAQVARRPGWTSLIRRPRRSRPALVGRRAAGA